MPIAATNGKARPHNHSMNSFRVAGKSSMPAPRGARAGSRPAPGRRFRNLE